ncbi:type II secretion system protein [bacterium]|nr:type II secretion system protein [bacterium]
MKSKAFTLVELLVVMAIISFLSVGAFAGLSFGLRQSRDVQKKKLVDLAHTAMQAYYADNAKYPKCENNSNGTLLSLPGVTSQWYYCPGAFPRTGTGNSTVGGYLINQGGTTGVKDYLEGEWPTGNSNADPAEGDKYLRYYYSPGTSAGSALKFAVCISLENKTSSQNLKNIDTGVQDCYCAGTEYAEVRCKGISQR